MSTDDEILKRDKEILTHIQHRYDEEERRFQTVDSKISSMIAVLIMGWEYWKYTNQYFIQAINFIEMAE